MTHRILILAICLFTALTADAAMVRVTAIEDSRTITIDRDGTLETIRLAGVEITDDKHALDLLRWTLASHWVMLERTTSGEHLVWRSPDALFVNRELVVRGYARATLAAVAPESTLIVTYLGEYNPIATRPTPAATARGTYSGTRPRSPVPRARSGRARAATGSSGRTSRRTGGRSSGS